MDCREPDAICNIFQEIDNMSDEELDQIYNEINLQTLEDTTDSEAEVVDVKEPKNNDVYESEMEHDGYDSHVEYYTRRDDAKYFLMQPVLYLIPLKGKVSSL